MFARREEAMRTDRPEPDDDLDEGDLDEEQDEGEEVLSVDWDSGGPGAGAGTSYVVKRGGEYRAVFPDFGESSGPFDTLAEAVASTDIGKLTSACQSLDYKRGEVRLKELLDALEPMEGEPTVAINGTPWRFGGGRWRRCRG
jgi:hypothetical protein